MATPRKKVNPPETKVVNILHTAEYHVYVGRVGFGMNGYYGTPFKLWKDGTREELLEKYKRYFYKRLNNDQEFLNKIHSLKGKILGCFCTNPALCHGTVIANYLNEL